VVTNAVLVHVAGSRSGSRVIIHLLHMASVKGVPSLPS